MYGALDVRLFPNQRLNGFLKNIEIWVLHGLNALLILFQLFDYVNVFEVNIF